MRDHTAKPFKARSTDYICVGFQGNNRVFVKDNHGKITKVNRRDVTPIEMDIKIAELFKDSRKESRVRDAQLAMPTSKIPDLGWKFDEDVQLVEPVMEQVYSLEQVQRKAQTTDSTPTKEEETVPVQPIEEPVTEVAVAETVEIQAVRTPEVEEQTLVFKFMTVLAVVTAVISQQIMNRTYF